MNDSEQIKNLTEKLNLMSYPANLDDFIRENIEPTIRNLDLSSQSDKKMHLDALTSEVKEISHAQFRFALYAVQAKKGEEINDGQCWEVIKRRIISHLISVRKDLEIKEKKGNICQENLDIQRSSNKVFIVHGDDAKMRESMSEWKRLTPKEVADLVKDCINNSVTREQANFALREINVRPGVIGHYPKDIEYYTQIIEYLYPRTENLLLRWLLALAKDPFDPEHKWSGFRFAIDWLNKLAIATKEEDRRKAAYIREVFINPRDEDFLRPVTWLLEGYESARCVARLKFEDGASGSGFLVANNLLLTNHHVIWSKKTRDFRTFQSVLFDYFKNLDGDIEEKRVTNCEILFFEADADFAVIKIDPISDRKIPCLNPNNLQTEDLIFIAQHPNGEELQIAINNNTIKNLKDHFIEYEIPTQDGSSGSALFNDNWEIVGIHCGCRESKEFNKGIAISQVLEILRNKRPDIYKQLEKNIL